MTKTRYGIKENQARAYNPMIRISHKKLNLTCDQIRGLTAERAIDALKFSKKRVSGEVLKCLMSAIANAEHNKNLPVDSLYVKEVWCGKSLTMMFLIRAMYATKKFDDWKIVLVNDRTDLETQLSTTASSIGVKVKVADSIATLKEQIKSKNND